MPANCNGTGRSSGLVELSETAVYSFSRPVVDLALELRMKCLTTSRQTALVDIVAVRPEPVERITFSDIFGNDVISLRFDRPLQRLVVSGYHRVACRADGPIAAPFLPEDLKPEEDASIAPNDNEERSPLQRREADDMFQELRRHWRYDLSVASLGRALAEIRATRRGVCQDIARLAVDALRRRGVPARYMVGYSIPAKRAAMLQRHAWIATYLGSEWAEIDVAVAPEKAGRRIATAWGSNLSAIGPVIGLTRVDARTSLTVAAQINML